ncbi:MAG: nucleotidyltransferase family protein [Bdellovibrionales bacterium]|nr:nucleotidyltransferase family protein [Bdellovibrionales bacterium]
MKVKLMILAAGLGTRLGEIGKTTPKCLLEVGGKTLLEHILVKARTAGINQVVINTHHLAQKISDFLAENKNFGFEIDFSNEDPILETGGGIKKAQEFLNDADIIIVHNGDIYSDFEFQPLIDFHLQKKCLVSLCVFKKDSDRSLVFDTDHNLCGWSNKSSGQQKIIGAAGVNVINFGFTGIYAFSPKFFNYMLAEEKFSVIDVFLNAAKSNEELKYLEISDFNWYDAGTPEKLELLRQFLSKQ